MATAKPTTALSARAEPDPYTALHEPWLAAGEALGPWMQRELPSILLSPAEIRERAVPLWEFRHIVDSLPAGSTGIAGVYFLTLRGRVSYVGITTQCVTDRLHATHNREKLFEGIAIQPLPWPRRPLEVIEAIYIDWLRPWDNVKVPGSGWMGSAALAAHVAKHGSGEDVRFDGLDDDDEFIWPPTARPPAPIHGPVRRPPRGLELLEYGRRCDAAAGARD